MCLSRSVHRKHVFQPNDVRGLYRSFTYMFTYSLGLTGSFCILLMVDKCLFILEEHGGRFSKLNNNETQHENVFHCTEVVLISESFLKRKKKRNCSIFIPLTNETASEKTTIFIHFFCE